MSRTPLLGSISTRQERIAELAREDRSRSFLSLSHHIDVDWLREAFHRTRRGGAPGVDGRTWSDYAEHLESNLEDLLDRFKSGRYRAPPVRRHFIPKAGGGPQSKRPIGIPTLEDKVLQRAVLMLLEPIYETDFSDVSYGFRPGRSCHQAIERLWQGSMRQGGGWILEVDIRSFFDELDRHHLNTFLDNRVRDGVIRRTLGKWLRAGVMDAGTIHYATHGTPQGGVISPLLANVYLHEVVDRWFRETVKPRLRRRAFLVRFADDMVFVFEDEREARRVLEVLPKRFARFGLRLHPSKTRLLPFYPPSDGGDSPRGPRGFEFLGFLHYWGRSRRKKWVVKRRTASSRLTRAVQRVVEWCRQHRHAPVGWQQEKLTRKLRGHYGYYGISGNYRSLQLFYFLVHRVWRKWLDRRSDKVKMDWTKFNRLLRRYSLPRPRIVHSYIGT